jgi:hypothetical protein
LILIEFGIVYSKMNWDSSVSKVTGYGLDDQGLVLSWDEHFVSSPPHLDKLWDPSTILLCSEYQGMFPLGNVARK